MHLASLTIHPEGMDLEGLNLFADKRTESCFSSSIFVSTGDTPITDFSHWRNYAFTQVPDDVDWVCIIDSDETVSIKDPKKIKYILEQDFVSTVRIFGAGGYMKEKLFRVPVQSFFVGPTHEYPDNRGNVFNINYPLFWFVGKDKTEDQIREKAKRDIDILTSYLEGEDVPSRGRWLYYLGQSYELLSMYRSAVDEYQRAFAESEWDEERAWSMYKAGYCMYMMGRMEEAKIHLMQGWLVRPDYAEFPYLLGLIAEAKGEMINAVKWTQAAIALWDNPRPERIGFSAPNASRPLLVRQLARYQPMT